jgi:DNA-binding HxlR family transcriptional regulator
VSTVEGTTTAGSGAQERPCPGHETLAILSTKWLTLVVEALEHGPRGHAELRRAIPMTTQKMLTQTLRQLERDGMVDRHVTPSVPPRVSYELTELGRALLPLQRQIREWGEQHIHEIEMARREHSDVAQVTKGDSDRKGPDPDTGDSSYRRTR